MSDLEDRLRDMMRERSGDIDTVPDRLLNIGVDEPTVVTDITPGRHRPAHRTTRAGRSRAWLLSAAAVAVIALGLGVLLGRGDGTDPDPVGSGGPTASPSPSSSSEAPTPIGPRSAVPLDWFGADRVTDYEVLMRSSHATYRDLAWRRAGETDYPEGGNGGVQTSAVATVFTRGAFAAKRSGVLDVRPTTEARGEVYRTEARRVVGTTLDAQRVPTIAWQYRPDEWVVVQALTKTVANAELARLADAVRPLTAVPITVPFRLSTPPPGQVEQIIDSRPTYPLIIVFGSADRTTAQLQVHIDAEGTKDDPGTITGKAGGLPAVVNSTSGGYVDYSGGVLTVEKSAGDHVDIAGINRLFDGLTWSGGDGSGPGVPLRSAIGR